MTWCYAFNFVLKVVASILDDKHFLDRNFLGYFGPQLIEKVIAGGNVLDKLMTPSPDSLVILRIQKGKKIKGYINITI